MQPKRPPNPVKRVAPTLKAKHKYTLSKLQHVQIEVINWKRSSVRSILIISYVTLIHLLAYLSLFGYGYHLIQKSEMLMGAFYGFFLDLGLYFFGCGEALHAITYSWRPVRFCVGITTILLGIFLNVALYFIGTYNSSKYNNGILPIAQPNCTKGSTDYELACKEQEPVRLGLLMIPLFLPPISIICVVIALISAFKAIYVTPKKFPKGQVDAVWLAPYETYDFYVGRNIPRIPGYDDDVHFSTPVNSYKDDDDTEDITTILDVPGENQTDGESNVDEIGDRAPDGAAERTERAGK